MFSINAITLLYALYYAIYPERKQHDISAMIMVQFIASCNNKFIGFDATSA